MNVWQAVYAHDFFYSLLKLVKFVPYNIIIGAHGRATQEQLWELGTFLDSFIFNNCAQDDHLKPPNYG